MQDAQAYLDTIQRDGFLGPMFSSYLLAKPYYADRVVLDFGCGYGWGSFLISQHCRRVTGYDIDRHRIRFARETFRNENLEFLSSSKGLMRGGYDVICLFQVLAHLAQPEKELEKLLEYLRPGGILLFGLKESAAGALRLLEEWRGEQNLIRLYRTRRYLSDADSVIETGYQLPCKGEPDDGQNKPADF